MIVFFKTGFARNNSDVFCFNNGVYVGRRVLLTEARNLV